ncbi:hypothetical protein SteCoe_37600 [Stentor coeruleus]|uniref:Uncharacterized protein n=1 Tax=Stentor coeruleus TaxID=5963 RepID=A0A1R2AMP8_9CILI|nr:hypothetical protein SteCoe_37600 [Stentor coeruleus]
MEVLIRKRIVKLSYCMYPLGISGMITVPIIMYITGYYLGLVILQIVLSALYIIIGVMFKLSIKLKTPKQKYLHMWIAIIISVASEMLIIITIIALSARTLFYKKLEILMFTLWCSICCFGLIIIFIGLVLVLKTIQYVKEPISESLSLENAPPNYEPMMNPQNGREELYYNPQPMLNTANDELGFILRE